MIALLLKKTDRATVTKITEPSHKNHPAVITIKKKRFARSFDLTPASKEDGNKIIRLFNANKETGLTSVMNHDVSGSYFSDGTKYALVRPIYKKQTNKRKLPSSEYLDTFTAEGSSETGPFMHLSNHVFRSQ